MKKETKIVSISSAALHRLPQYHCYLKSLSGDQTTISSAKIAEDLNLNPVLVRKDLAEVSSISGTPRRGFLIESLIADIESFLGYDYQNDAILVGVGRLGNTLLSYNGFANYGFSIIAAFDKDASIIGSHIASKEVFPISELKHIVKRTGVKIGIITVPSSAAQEVCDTMVEAGITAIWNFAPTHLSLPANVTIRNENLAASLALLVKQMK